MSSNTSKITSGFVTRRSAGRTITLRNEKTSPQTRNSKFLRRSPDAKKGSPSSEKKSYSLRNVKQSSHTVKISKRQSKDQKKSDLVYVSNNSDESTKEIEGETIKLNDDIILSSDDEKPVKVRATENRVVVFIEDSPEKLPRDPVETKTELNSSTPTENLNESTDEQDESKLELEESSESPEISFASDKMNESSIEEPRSDPIELTCPESKDGPSPVPEIKFEIVPNFSEKDGVEHKSEGISKSNQDIRESLLTAIESPKCKVYDPNLDDIMSDRPVSSNSLSTTSLSSHVQQENDLYSPGSTDLSLSEDSRGSFRESGNEPSFSGRRARGRMKGRLTFHSVRKNKRQSTNTSCSRSPSDDGSVEPSNKRIKRLPNRTGIVWEIGQRLEAVDHNEWYPAKIVEVDKDACEVLIHFEGWSVRFDEWVPMDSPKLRPPSISKSDKDKPTVKQQFKANEKIYARWNDGKLYEATVTQVLSDGHYAVLFYDGFTKKLPVSAMRKLNDKTIKERKLQMRFPSKSLEHRKLPFQRTPKPVDRNPTPGSPPVLSPTVASKQFIVETDHNQFKCTFDDCNKEFRKESLLQSHIKHYHLSGRAMANSPRKIKRRPRTKIQHLDTKQTVQTLKNNLEGPTAIVANVRIKEEMEEAEEVLQIPEAPAPASSESNIESAIVPAQRQEENLVEVKQDDLLVPKTESVLPPLKTVPMKIAKISPRKEVYPVTKMETRHAKPCLFRDDSIYTGYLSYRSLYTKNSKGPRKSTDVDATKKTRSSRNEDEKNVGETRKRKRRVFKRLNPKKHKSECPDIDDEIAEIKKRRVDRVSESSVKTDDTTRESIDYDDEETISDQQEAYEDEVVRCICENEEENGLMFQCEECKTWQHAACFNIENEEDVPDTYFCYVCTKAKGAAAVAVQSEKDAWLNDGVLSSFNFLKDNYANATKPNAVLATHELVNSTKKVMSILRGLQHKMQIVGKESDSDLKYWSKPWKQTAAQRIHNILPQHLNLPGQSTADSQDVLVFDHAYFSHSDGVIGFQEEVVTELPDIPCDNIDLPLPPSNDIILPEVSTSKLSGQVEEPKEKIPSKRRTSAREGGRGRGGRWRDSSLSAAPEEKTADVGTCKNNLIRHIHDVQDNVEQGLDLIENQISLLEAEMNVPGENESSDMMSVLKSIKNLSKDLDVVQRFTFL